MRLLLLWAGAALLAPQESKPAAALSFERTVRVTTIDTLDRRREVHRKEAVHVRGANLAIHDLTFGKRLIVRPDLKLVWKADLLAGEFSEISFEEIARIRGLAVEELRSARARVPGTAEERELQSVLEGLDQFAQEPKVELKASASSREILVNGDRVRISVEIDPSRREAAGAFEALAAIGAFHPAVAAKLKDLDGMPMKGTLRYVLFLDRVVEQFEVTAVKPAAPAEAEFERPPGLKKVPLQGFGPPADRKPPKPSEFNRDFKEDDRDKKPKDEKP